MQKGVISDIHFFVQIILGFKLGVFWILGSNDNG